MSDSINIGLFGQIQPPIKYNEDIFYKVKQQSGDIDPETATGYISKIGICCPKRIHDFNLMVLLQDDTDIKSMLIGKTGILELENVKIRGITFYKDSETINDEQTPDYDSDYIDCYIDYQYTPGVQ